MHKSITTAGYQRVIERFKKVRLDAELTTRDLGEILGESHSFVVRVETLQRRLDIYQFVMYCRALGLDPATTIKILES